MSTPDLPSVVAALSGTVAALGTRFSLLAAKADAAASREGVEALVARFEELAQAVADLEAESPKGPAAINWAALDEAQHGQALAALGEWVNAILLPWYPSCGLPGCWPNHPQAVTELSNIWLAWCQAYQRRRPDLKMALDWHDRWFPNAMRRIEFLTRNCMAQCSARRE
jgi:hypothetical protein